MTLSRNPFPAQAVTTIEGVEWSKISSHPTYVRQPVRRLATLVRRYLDDARETSSGRAAALHGEHGTGKTRCLLYALAQAAEPTTVAGAQPFLLYARADSADTVALYRKLTSRLELSALRMLAADAFAGYAAVAYQSDRPGDSTSVAADRAALISEPSMLRGAIVENVIPLTDIIDHQARDIARIEGRLGSFDRAVDSLRSAGQAELAHRWLVGGELSPAELKRLGLKENLATADDVRSALHVLAALCRQARRPFLLALDQAESLLLDDKGELSRGNAGFLRALVEAIVAEGGLALVSTSEKSWQLIPVDLQQRFGPASFPVLALTRAEATGLVSVYLSTSSVASPGITADGIDEILLASGGNARRFLQACHLVYRAGTPSDAPLTRTLVEERLADGAARVTPTIAALSARVSAAMERAGLDVEHDRSIGTVTVQVVGVRDGRDLVLAKLNDPIYGESEAQQAIETLDVVSAALATGAKTILVVMGYTSPDVVQHLRRAVFSLIIANGPGYESQLDEAVKSIVDIDTTPSPTADRALARDIEALRAELATVVERRQSEEGAIDQGLRHLSRSVALAALPEDLQQFNAAWAAERERISDEIRGVRLAQYEADVLEIVQLQTGYLAKRRRRLTTAAAALTVVVLTAVVSAFSTGSTDPGLALVGILLLLVGALGAVVAFWRSSADIRATRGVTARDVEALALRNRGGSANQMVQSPIPLRRHAALLGSAAINQNVLAGALDREPSRLLRRSIARRLCGSSPGGSLGVLHYAADPTVRSVAIEYVCRERVGALIDVLRTGDTLLGVLANTPSLAHLAAFYGVEPPDTGFLSRFLFEINRQQPTEPLAVAYQSADDRELIDVVSKTPDRLLRLAVHGLDPREPTGVGSYYWLSARAELDEIYLFFRKLIYLSGFGLQSPDPSAYASESATSTPA